MFEILIKGEKSIFWSGHPHADQNGIWSVGTPTRTSLTILIQAQTDVAKLAGV